MSPLFQMLFAQAAESSPAGDLARSPLFFIVIMLGFLYFAMIRPQQKQARESREMLSSLKKGDEVVTTGGMVGKIYAVTDKFLTLEVAKDVRIRVLKSAVQSRHAEAPAEPAHDAKSETKEKKEEGR